MTKKTAKTYNSIAAQIRETTRMLELGELSPQDAHAILIQCQKDVKEIEQEETSDQLLNNIKPLLL